jgi:hypothetical protein
MDLVKPCLLPERARILVSRQDQWAVCIYCFRTLGMFTDPAATTVKIHYTFDKEGQVNCLARWPQILHVQTIPLDEKTLIGIIDLKLCAQAVVNCSPELLNQPEADFTVYAVDYSEPDTPLVGQGMLSWIFDSTGSHAGGINSSQMITGRVTKNLLAAFGKGISETLEVRLKLTEVRRMERPAPQPQLRQQHARPSVEIPQTRPVETVLTPGGTAEWTSFIQSNPQLGRIQSPALVPIRPEPTNPMQRRESSFAVTHDPNPSDEPSRLAPVPVDVATIPIKGPSRPSSRASTKRNRQTGRPRGRPRKNPLPTEGNTSGYEDGTEAEDGMPKKVRPSALGIDPVTAAADDDGTEVEDAAPKVKKPKTAMTDKAAPVRYEDAMEADDAQEDGPPKKKRAQTEKADRNNSAQFGGIPDSLRVAASTSAGIRNFRPIVPGVEAPVGNHLLEVPRAPTPVPQGPAGGPKRKPRVNNNSNKLRRQSTMSQELSQAPYTDAILAVSPGQEEGRSPLDSPAPTVYSEDSPVDIGSSPPVPRSTRYMASSPPPSSPILPPMPQPDSGFMSGGVDDLFDEELHLPQDGVFAKPAAKKARGQPNNIPIQIFKLQEMAPGGDQELIPVQPMLGGWSAPTSAPTLSEASHASSIPTLKRARTESELPLLNPNLRDGEEHIQGPETQSSETVVLSSEYFAPRREDSAREERGAEKHAVERNSAKSGEFSLPRSKSVQNVVRPGSNPPRPSRSFGRSVSMGPLALPTILASDPVASQTLALPTLPNTTSFSEAPCPPSEAPCPPTEAPAPPTSPPQSRSNKNFVKKQSIKQRLEKAIDKGEMPPFCNNCGAIETPTWRKMWTQDRVGVPEQVEFSEKPGRVTAIDILDRDANEKPSAYRVTMKNIGPQEQQKEWTPLLLCNRKDIDFLH